jgi:hypothetical protein
MGTFNIDKTAPRARVTTNCLDVLQIGYWNDKKRYIRTGEFYKKIKSNNPILEKYTNLQIRNYVRKFNENIADICVDHKDGIILPMRTGHILTVVSKGSGTGIDRKASQEAGKIKYYRNEHSEGYVGKIYYSTYEQSPYKQRPQPYYENNVYWSFSTGRTLALKITDGLRSNWKKYKVITETKKKNKDINKKERSYPRDGSNNKNNEFNF